MRHDVESSIKYLYIYNEIAVFFIDVLKKTLSHLDTQIASNLYCGFSSLARTRAHTNTHKGTIVVVRVRDRCAPKDFTIICDR